MGITKTTGFSEVTIEMAEILKALGHPARLAIIDFLIKSPSCICGDIVDELPLAQSTVSRHLSELKKVGLIKGSIEGTNICYCVNEDVLAQVQNFFTTTSNSLISKKGCC